MIMFFISNRQWNLFFHGIERHGCSDDHVWCWGQIHLAEDGRDLPLDVVGLDWRLSVDAARERGLTKTLQGNLDPSYLLAPWEILEAKTKEILDMGMKRPGFIFNLGHGIFPEVDPEVLKRLTAYIHDYSKEKMEVAK